jgi:hypothetical protein
MLDRLLSFHDVGGKREGAGDGHNISAESVLIIGESNWIQTLFGLSGLSGLSRLSGLSGSSGWLTQRIQTTK